jgi:ATP/maltotriose-dependent transcriptional regulator MalT
VAAFTTTTPNAVVVLRFLGTSALSGSARDMLHSICKQVGRAYSADGQGDGELDVPASFDELVQYLPRMLALATATAPLALFLDSLDQLSDADGGRRLTWLPVSLPPHVALVVSTLPDVGGCLARLQVSSR